MGVRARVTFIYKPCEWLCRTLPIPACTRHLLQLSYSARSTGGAIMILLLRVSCEKVRH